MQAVAGVPLWEVCRPGQKQGDKALLRAVAQRAGLRRAAVREKRAIQFGTRISKAHNVRNFGSNRAANRRHAGSCVAVDATHA